MPVGSVFGFVGAPRFASNMGFKQSLFFGVILVAWSRSCYASPVQKVASVVWDGTNGRFRLKDFNSTYNNIAWGVFVDDRQGSGWASLEIHTDGFYPDDMQAFSAGILEGSLTERLISEQFHNVYGNYCKNDPVFCTKLFTYLEANLDSMVDNVRRYSLHDPYWHMVALSLVQVAGVQKWMTRNEGGLQADESSKTDFVYVGNNLTPNVSSEWILLNLHGDLDDLQQKFNWTGEEVSGSGSCSAIVKIAPGNRDVYFGHATWTGYNTMNRILKKYRFNYHTGPTSKKLVPGTKIAFSGYPGRVYSGDDFYLINTGLAVMETTIGNENANLWSKVTPNDTVPTGIRNMVANRLATSGQEWTTTFARYNSGTYNNQWMVLNYNLFKAGSPKLEENFLWILEQIPGLILKQDVTPILESQGYWSSYNTPYFPRIFNESGLPDMVKKYGNWWSYDKSPRALMFKRDQAKAVDMQSVMKLLRYNDFKHDPLSRCEGCDPPYNAENAISARSDLNPDNGTYPFAALERRPHGGTDAKLVNSSLFWGQEFLAVSGPTWDMQPPFCWSTSGFDDIGHDGHPDLWNFNPILQQWLPRL